MSILDTVFLYVPDTHITADDCARWLAGRMASDEGEAFRYHLSECKLCQAFVSDWLKKKSPDATSATGPGGSGA